MLHFVDSSIFWKSVPIGHLLMSVQAITNIENNRRYWNRATTPTPELNLIQLQLDSYHWFLSEGIKEVLAEITPVEDFTGKNWTLLYYMQPK